MAYYSDSLNQDNRSFTPAILLLVIGIIIISIFVLLILKNNSHTSEIIGVISFIATLFAIYFAYGASLKTISKIEELKRNWALFKTDNNSDQFNVKFTEKERKISLKRHIYLAKVIEEILIKYSIPYVSEYSIETPDKIVRPDYVIYLENRRIPLELKTFPKRISLPISKQRINMIKSQMKKYMDALPSEDSILIIWNPEITPNAKEMLERVDDKTIYLINNEDLAKIEDDFRDLLMAFKI